MKTRPDSLIQLKSGRDSHRCFRIRQLFCHTCTSGSEHRYLKPDCACKLTKTIAVVLAQLTFFFQRVFFFYQFILLLPCFVAVHPSSSFPASSEAGLSQAGDTRIPLPRKSLGALTTNCRLQSWTLYKSSDCRWISITILCVRFTTSAIVGRLEQV